MNDEPNDEDKPKDEPAPPALMDVTNTPEKPKVVEEKPKPVVVEKPIIYKPKGSAKTARGSSKRALKRQQKREKAQALKKLEKEMARKLKKENDREARAVEKGQVQEVQLVVKTELTDDMAGFAEFQRVFSKFKTPDQLKKEKEEREAEEKRLEEEEAKGVAAAAAEHAASLVVEKPGDAPLSRKELKKRNRLSIADLKQLVERPNVVELHDCNSADPKLLVHLKSYRNTVPVPSHWAQKRKYLQNKRGYEKPQFELPDFIAATGVAEIRTSVQDKATEATSKQKQRARTHGKLSGTAIDYEALHDAFFKFQTKPWMTDFGSMYYEGREFEVKLKTKRPGELTDELRRALALADETSPPPWLFNMQRFGPPPSYNNLKIPGVNTPIPPGARYGYGPGEWGKPPVDEYGRPLYGDVFGTEKKEDAELDSVDKTQWGVVQEEEEEDDDEEEEDEDEDEDDEDDDMESGMESISSMTSGTDTPETLQLRKKDASTSESSEPEKPKQLYQVLEQTKTGIGSKELFGSSHSYSLPQQSDAERRIAAKQAKAKGEVHLALNPEDLEGLDAMTLKRKYEAQLEAETVSKHPVQRESGDDESAMKKRKMQKAAGDKKKFKYKF